MAHMMTGTQNTILTFTVMYSMATEVFVASNAKIQKAVPECQWPYIGPVISLPELYATNLSPTLT